MKNACLCMAMAALIMIPSDLAAAEEQSGDSSRRGDAADRLPETTLPVGPILLGGFGLVGIAVGAGFGWQAWEENELYHETGSEVALSPVYPNASEDLASDIRVHSMTANILIFGGTAVVIGSFLWWLLSPKYKRARSNQNKAALPVLMPVIAPAQAGLTVRF